MRVLSDTNDRTDSQDAFQIIINVDDDIPTENFAAFASSSSSSLDNHFILPEGDNEPQKQIQESISLILQMVSNCRKLTTGDIFLKGKLKEIYIQDGNFYFYTVQSLKHTEQLIPHAKKVIQFIDSLKIKVTNASEFFHLMTISEELIKDSKKKKEFIGELIKNYDDNLKSIMNILEGIKQHKESVSKAKDLLPINVTEIKRIQREFEKWDREAKVYFSYVKGFFVCFGILVFFEMMDFLGSYYINIHQTIMVIVYGILLLLGVIVYLYASDYRSNADNYLWEANKLKREMEKKRQEIANTNDEDTRIVELYLAKIICQFPSVLEYWKKHKDDLEELTIVNNYDQENMDEKWNRNMKNCEDYNRLVGDILDRNEGEKRKIDL